jgi:hypothetical protein
MYRHSAPTWCWRPRLAIGLLAALGPARQGLAIQPTEALKEDG